MSKCHFSASDLHGYSRLAIDATLGVTNIVETIHNSILENVVSIPVQRELTRGITRLVYQSISGITRLVGFGIDTTFALLPHVDTTASLPASEALRAVLNGVIGDHLKATANPLAIPVQLRYQGSRLRLAGNELKVVMPNLSNRIIVLLHGLCMNDLQWTRQGHNHGLAIAAELGYTPLFLHYNSGLRIFENGRAVSQLLEDLIKEWPVEIRELVIIGHSMGGLVTRAACHYAESAGHCWRQFLQKIIFLGTPHHGAPLEQIGNQIEQLLELDRYLTRFPKLGQQRSAGIKDLRYGNFLVDAPDRRPVVPLPAGVASFAIAATLGKREGDIKDILLGDGLVPLNSALGSAADAVYDLKFPESHKWIGYRLGHLELLSNPAVYQQIKHWLSRQH